MHESTPVATRRPVARIILASGLFVALVLAAVAIWVPRWVKTKIIAAAAAHGVALTIGDLGIGIGHAKLKNVMATALIRSDAKGAPKASATAALVDVTLDWFTPTAIDVTALKISLDADARDLSAALASRNAPGGSAASITRITLHDASLEWNHAVPIDSIALSADHIDGDVTKKDARALGEDYSFEAKELRTTPKKDLAAWSAKISSSELETLLTLRIGATLVSISSGKTFTLAVDATKVTTKDVGLPPDVLGLYGDETSLFDLHLHHEERDGRGQGTFVGQASNVFLGTSMARTRLSLDAQYGGDATTHAMKLTSGTLVAGPFTGALEGSFSIDPFKASLRYSSGVMACVDAIKAQAASYGAVGQGVATLAGMLGLDKAVEGRISLKGEIEIDAATHANRFAFRTQGDCKLSYLPSAL